MATPQQPDELPQVEVFNRVLSLPVVERALSTSASTYCRVRDYNQIVHWIVSKAENSIYSATKHAVPIAAPIAQKFATGIHFVDQKLCIGLDKIEENVPIITESPEQILEKSYMFALQTVKPAVSTISYANDLIISQASSLKNLSWNKANQILNTHYGTVAIDRLDSTALIVDKLIDKYFPPIGDEDVITEPTSSEEDKLLHTLQTVGKLSNKTARRVYSNVTNNLKTLNKDKIKMYIGNVVEFLQITHYLHVVNDKVQQLTGPSKTKKSKTKKNSRRETTNGHVKKE
ncbi:hypothetical protein PV327_002097 [Microctonus hyperodae]|uniref:Lipid storage droplets surface-binding protein 2 n=1 Tax=Microctonus hyperodae TaxID=165561 RepID=A0AA39FEX0_MICHY|nr:hypothetical protein PV327_002097 [Microctonus hyperodae]